MENEKRLIDANALGNGLGVYVATNSYLNDTVLDALGMVAKWLDEAPTVDAVEVVHGQWKRKKHKIFGNSYDYVCSVCGCDYALAEYVYCPNCGAKMDG